MSDKPDAARSDSRPGQPHLVVTGLMGVGKSTTAQQLAARLGRPHRDSDEDLDTLFSTTGAELARRHGVDELHRLEAAVLLGALADRRPAVISAAAWVVEDERCREAMARRATVVILEAPIDSVLSRMAAGDHRRSMDRSELDALARRRAPLYRAVADITVDATGRPDEVVSMIVSAAGLDSRFA